MKALLHIGEIAQLLGVTPKTIRHYHKIGLLKTWAAHSPRLKAGVSRT